MSLYQDVLNATAGGTAAGWLDRIAMVAHEAGLPVCDLNLSGSPATAAFSLQEVARRNGATDRVVQVLQRGLPPMRLERARELLQGWVDQQGHDRCWYYPDIFKQLCEVLDVEATAAEPKLPPRPEFEEGCRRFQEEQYGV